MMAESYDSCGCASPQGMTLETCLQITMVFFIYGMDRYFLCSFSNQLARSNCRRRLNLHAHLVHCHLVST
jgi:hypothetical protein